MLTLDQTEQIKEKFNLITSEVNDLFSSSSSIPDYIIKDILSNDGKKIEESLLLLQDKYVNTHANIMTVLFMLIGSKFILVDKKIKYIHDAMSSRYAKNDNRYYEVIFRLSIFYLLKNNVSYAKKMLEKILKNDDIEFTSPITYRKTLIELSKIYTDKKNYKHAISLLNQALECYNIREKETINIKFYLLVNYKLLKEYKTALSYKESLMEDGNEFMEDFLRQIAGLYAIQGEHLKAKEIHLKAIEIIESKISQEDKNSHEYIRLSYLNAFHNFNINQFNKSLNILNSLLKIDEIEKSAYYILICLVKLDNVNRLNYDRKDIKKALDVALSCDGIEKDISYFHILYNKYAILQAYGQNNNECQKIKDQFCKYYKNSQSINNEQYIGFFITYLKLKSSNNCSDRLLERFYKNINSYTKEDTAFVCFMLKKYDEALKELEGVNNLFANSMKIDIYIKMQKFTFAIKLIDQTICEEHILEEHKAELNIKKIACLSDLKKHEEMNKLLRECMKNTSKEKSPIHYIYFEYFSHLIQINRIDVTKNNHRNSYDILINLLDFIKKGNYESWLIKIFYDEIIFRYSLLNFIFAEKEEELNLEYFLNSLHKNEDNFKANLVNLIFNVCQPNKLNTLEMLTNKIEIISNIIINICKGKQLDKDHKFSKGNILNRLKEFLSNIQEDLKHIIEKDITIINSIEDFYNLKLSFPKKALYRGMNRATWKIEPTIIRDNKLDKLDSYYLANFQREAYALTDVNLSNYKKLDWLSLMQHHGNLSPLLDWTKSLNVALFFALDDEDKKNPGIPVICTMAYKNIESHDDVQKKINNDNLNDIVLFAPKVLHKRLNRQSGVFTYHPRSKLKIEEQDHFVIKRYAISPAVISDLKNLLRKDNINCSTIYPDLDFLSKHIKSDLDSNFNFAPNSETTTRNPIPYSITKNTYDARE